MHSATPPGPEQKPWCGSISASVTSPFRVPACCETLYTAKDGGERPLFSVDAVSPISSTGGGVDTQSRYVPNTPLADGAETDATRLLRGLYRDRESLAFRRVKPGLSNQTPNPEPDSVRNPSHIPPDPLHTEVVAPGVNIVSARSDGDPYSGGTRGCRCCTSTQVSEF